MPQQERSARPTRRYHHGELRAALLAAAEEELSAHGVEGFTLRGCAKRAGVSHAAPSHHFADANALLTELARIGFERFAAAMTERAMDAGAGPRDRLTAAGLGYVAFAAANPALFGLMFASARPDFSNAALNQAASAAFQTLIDAVEAARAPQGGGRPELMIDATAAWAMAHGLAGLLLTGRSNLLAQAEGASRDALLADIFARVLPVQPKDGREV